MRLRIVSVIILIALALTGCDALAALAPPPAATAPPSPTPTPEPEPTATPTLGPREFIDSAFCWKSHIDTGEYNLVRFFSNGVVIDVFVQPYDDCQAAWQSVGVGLTLDKARAVNHGEYHLSGAIIRYGLAKPGSDDVVGFVNGVLEGGSLTLHKQGTDGWEHVQVYGDN